MCKGLFLSPTSRIFNRIFPSTNLIVRKPSITCNTSVYSNLYKTYLAENNLLCFSFNAHFPSYFSEFFERTIQLNSEGWGCSFCGHQNLNYNEAVACEAGDAARLAEFGPPGLCRGLLHIILGAKRRRMNELVDVMLAFASSRYFIGEELCVRNTDPNVAAAEIP